ncbi:hypothetical protein [Agromyces sp. Soil535]|uniref:hypothetical protein n=1 Tax=Agromyces sp. Soil535 TaxID=1736390 RepID=UPI0007006906|nr:hypothetical protein [Agromyces sp. Soil535]KRE29572.1 hypothetical protein ASG80_19215 [Agromyces sp. Soil535]
MSADGSDGRPAKPRRTSLYAIIGLLIAVGSFMLPAVPAVVAGAGAVVLGVLGRRQFRRDPRTGPSWVSLAAIIVGGFVLASQALLLAVFTVSG